MINAFEFQKIKTSLLPASWQEEKIIEDLEFFLQDNWELRKSLYPDRELTSVQQFIDFDKKDGFKTRNYIGTVCFRGEQLNIFPKIYKEDEDDQDPSKLDERDLISDLVIWLDYCNKYNYPFVSLKSDIDNSVDSLLELMITVYVRYVKSEVERQPFFKYEDVEEEGNFVKGRIDFTDFIVKKFPMGQAHTIRYTYSSFEYDNLLNQIIKYTCRYIRGKTKQKTNKKIINDILMKLGDVSDRNCQPYDCDKIKLNSLQARYSTILSLSKMFLLNKLSNEKIGVRDSFCFLFPAEDIFEGFIAGFMKDTFDADVKISTQSRKLYLTELVVNGKTVGNRFQLKEDILVEYKNLIIVMDTKYKEIEKLNKILDSNKLDIADQDMHQMAVYANRQGAKKVYLLYPLYRGDEPDSTEVIFNILNGPGETENKIPVHILQVPFSLCDNISCTKEMLTKILKGLLFP